MSDTSKQLPTIQNTLDMMPISHFYDEKTGRMMCFADDIKGILEYRDKEVVKYTLEQAAEKANLHGEGVHRSITDCQDSVYVEDRNGPDFIYTVNKESILSLEEQIIKDLGI
jgi:dTDP-D-glucose 4,6-dehydratase